MSITIGTKVKYINGSWRGEIIEMTGDRVRIQWFKDDGSKDKRTWQARKAQGKRWDVVAAASCFACSALSANDPATLCGEHEH